MPQGCDCVYESVFVPGERIAPVIVSELTMSRYPALRRMVEQFPCMRPRGLYRCIKCRDYIYVTDTSRPLRLVEKSSRWRRN